MATQKLYAGAKLRELRGRLGLTQRVFADKLGVSLPYLNQMENNHRPVSAAVVLALAQEFGLDAGCFRIVRSRLVEGAPRDPYDVLGLPRNATRDEARKAWRGLVRDTHPDVLQSRGVPPEAMKLAERRLQLINEAWREISAKVAA